MTSEEFLLTIYRDCWNNLDFTELSDYLDDDVVYNSQWVLQPIQGKTAFLEYIIPKFKTIKESRDSLSVSAEIKVCKNYYGEINKPHLLITQISSGSIVEIGLFIKVKEGKIIDIHLCGIW